MKWSDIYDFVAQDGYFRYRSKSGQVIWFTFEHKEQPGCVTIEEVEMCKKDADTLLAVAKFKETFHGSKMVSWKKPEPEPEPEEVKQEPEQMTLF